MSISKVPDGAPLRNFYGRRKGKTLRPKQVLHLNTTLREFAPSGVERADNPARNPLDFGALFGNDNPVWLEIGFGGGEHLLHMAKTYGDINILGCEAFINGVAMLMPHIAAENIQNVRIHMGDARDLLEVIPAGSLDKMFLLYPDPWPKKRHNRRRFINDENLQAMAQALKPGAELRLATDIEDYVRHTLQHMADRDDFVCPKGDLQNWRAPWPDWTKTRYEAKALQEGRTPHYLTFHKNG